MLARPAAYALLAAFAALAPPAAQGAGEKPLRTLTFEVRYAVSSTREQRISGLSYGQSSGPTSATVGLGGDDSGTMTVNVVAATADKGLVVDVSYNGKTTKQPPIRVAILSDGRLGYDPKTPICDQALQVLPLLARGMFLDRELAQGVSWSTPYAAPVTGTKSYRVTAVSGMRVTFAVSSSMTLGGPQGFDEHTDGTLEYEVDAQAPLRLDVQTRGHRVTPDGLETTDTSLSATLQSDTLPRT
jgi:hypothetical protein